MATSVQFFRRFNAELKVSYSHTASERLRKKHWAVTESFIYYVRYKYSSKHVIVPLGYLTDGASVPHPFRRLIKPWGRHGQACVVHDYLCEHLTVSWCGNTVAIDRKEADEIFLEAMEVLEVPFLKRWTMYLAVRAWAIATNKKTATKANKKTKVQEELIAHYNQTGQFT